MIVEINIPAQGNPRDNRKKYNWIDWMEFRIFRDQDQERAKEDEISDIDQRTNKIAEGSSKSTKGINTGMETQ